VKKAHADLNFVEAAILSLAWCRTSPGRGIVLFAGGMYVIQGGKGDFDDSKVPDMP